MPATRPKTAGPIGEKTRSEKLFERVLARYGMHHWEHGKKHPGSSKRPDYTVQYHGGPLVCEVKEFQPTPDDFRGGVGCYDAYRFIREKIETAGEQLKAPAFRQLPCALVLFNAGKPLVDLRAHMVCGAMFGDLGWTIPVNPGKGLQMERATTAFLGRGKMRNERREDGRIKRINLPYRVFGAIIILEIFGIGLKVFHIECCRRRAELGRNESVEELFEWLDTARGKPHDPARKLLRLITCVNPFAWTQFPLEIFRGPWDEQYGQVDGAIQRIYAGPEIRMLEQELERCEARHTQLG